MTEGTRIIDVQASILKDNDDRAEALRRSLTERGVFLVNVMGSPGSGKTSLLSALLPLLSPPLRPAVIEADLDSSVDADALKALGWPAVQLRTGGFCHLDAFMTERGLAELGLTTSEASVSSSVPGIIPDRPLREPPYDCVFIENIGNLICTAQVDTGAHLNLALLSVPEGDDKPLKYPVMFAKADIVIVSKADYRDREPFDAEALRSRVAALRADSRLFVVSARTGEGLDALARELLGRIRPGR